MSLGERIIQLRKEKGLSQGQLAKLMDVSRQAVSKWENGLSSPDTVKLILLADILDTEVEYLATGKEPALPQPPIIVNLVEKKDQVRVVEKVVEKPVIKHRIRVKYRRNPLEYAAIGFLCFLIGLLIGYLI